MIVEEINKNGWSVSSLGDGSFGVSGADVLLGAGSQSPRRGLDIL